MRRLLEDISVQIVDLRLSMTFLNQERTAPGPTATLSVAMLMLRTTDAHGNVVTLAQARSAGRRGTDITVHKEVFLGSAQFAVAGTRADGTALRADVLRVQPGTLHVAATRALHGLRPHTVAVTGVLPLLIAQADADTYRTLMEAVTGLLWCRRAQAPAPRSASPAPDTPDLVLPAPGDLADDGLCDTALEEAFADECDGGGDGDDDGDGSGTDGVPTVTADVLVAKVEVRCPGVARLVVDKCRLALQADALPPGAVDTANSSTKHQQVTACCVVEQLECVDLSEPGTERPVVTVGGAAAGQTPRPPLARVQATCRRALRGTRPTARSPPLVELYAQLAPLDVAVTEAFVRRCADVFYFRPVRPWPTAAAAAAAAAAPRRGAGETLWFLEDVRAHIAVPHVAVRVCECGGAAHACTLAAAVDGLEACCARLPEALSSYYSAAFHQQPAQSSSSSSSSAGDAAADNDAQRDFLYEPEVHELCAPATVLGDGGAGAAGPFALMRGSVALAGCTVAVTAPEIAQPAHTVRLVDVRAPRVRAELFRPLDYIAARGSTGGADAPALVVKADAAVHAAVDHAALWHCAQLADRTHAWLAAHANAHAGKEECKEEDKDDKERDRKKKEVLARVRERVPTGRTAVALRVHDVDVVCTASGAVVPALLAELERLGAAESPSALRPAVRALARGLLLRGDAACPAGPQCEVVRATVAAVHVLARRVPGVQTAALDALCEGLAVRADGGAALGVRAVLRTADSADWFARGRLALHGAVRVDRASGHTRAAPSCHAELRGAALELRGPLARCVAVAHRVQAALAPYVRDKLQHDTRDNAGEGEGKERHRHRRQVRGAVAGGKRRLFGVAVTADVEDVALSYAVDEGDRPAAVTVVVAPAVPADEAALLAARAGEAQAAQRARHAAEAASVAAQLAEQGAQARALQAVLVDARLRAGEYRQECAALDRAAADAACADTRAAKQCALAAQENARLQALLAPGASSAGSAGAGAEAGAALSAEIVALEAQLAAACAERDALAQERDAQRAACERELEAFERARDAEEQQLRARVAALAADIDAHAARTAAAHAARSAAADAQHRARLAARANNECSMFAVLPAVVRAWDGPAAPAPAPPAVPPPVPPRRPPPHAAPRTPPPRPPKPAVLSLSLNDDSLFGGASQAPAAQPSSSLPGTSATAATASADPFASLLA